MTNEQINPFTALTSLDPKFRFEKTDQPMGLLGVWMWRFRSRRALQRMDVHLREDLGLSGAEIDREVAKPFWQA